MDATKNRGKSKIFTCFKPDAYDDHEPGCDSASPPSSGDADDEAAMRRKKRLRRTFSAALKAVLFKTSLKKSRSENSRQDSDGRRSNLLSKSKRLVNSMKKNLSCKPFSEPDQIFRTNSDRSSLFSSNSSSRTPSLASSSSASSCSSDSRSGSEIKRTTSIDLRQMSQLNKQKTVKRDCARKCSYNLALETCVLLVCLVALSWGKVFAIVTCTSAWLFFAPGRGRARGLGRSRQQQQQQQLQRADSFDIIDSEECKKRVIMEGLLERNR